jgi:hypothetical protein
MPELNALYLLYLTNPAMLDTLLVAVTRYATGVARRRGHSDPGDLRQRATIQAWKR